MTKLEKIAQQEQKAREKIAAMQALLKQIDGERTEQENLQIVQQVRALKLSRDELYAFITGGDIPASLAEAFTSPIKKPETILSRRGRPRRNEPETSTTPDTETPDGDNETTNFESEGMNNEEQ